MVSCEDEVSRLVSPAGTILDDRSEYPLPIPPQSLRGDGGLFTLRYNDSFGEEPDDEADDLLRLLSVPLRQGNETVAYLQVGHSLESIEETRSRLLALLLISGPILVLLAAGVGYWLAGQTLAPIEAIRRRAASISAQDLRARIDFPISIHPPYSLAYSATSHQPQS